MRLRLLVALFLASAGTAQAQVYPQYQSTSGGPVPAVTLLCPGTGTAATTCSFGGGGGGGAITAAAGSYSAGALVDGAIVTMGTKADAAWSGTGTGSMIALEKAIYNALIAPLPAGTNALGSVTVSNFPATQAVSAASLPLPTGAATSANQVAGTAAGTTASTAEPIQGVTGGVPIPISGSITATNPSVGTTGATAPTSATYIGLLSGTNLVGVSSSNPVPVSSASLPLPTGAATAANQTNVQSSAGSSSSTVLSVQGNASGIAVPTQTQLYAPAACTASTITTGGTAVTFISGPINGGWIGNPLSASDQNIATAEVGYVNAVTTATANGRGTNDALQPGQIETLPPLKSGQNVSVIAATSSHAFSCRTF